MRLPSFTPQALLMLSAASSVIAASSWSFTDATLSVQGKGSGAGQGIKEKLSTKSPLRNVVPLTSTDTLKIVLTTSDGKTAKRAHQAFLTLHDSTTSLEISYPFNVKDSGKAKVDLTQKDLPAAFLRSETIISARIVIASFGSSAGYNSPAFALAIEPDFSSGSGGEKALRYGKLAEIYHIFRSDPKNPNILISLIFSGAVLATLPILLGTWLYLGSNVNHLSNAMRDAPVSHALFYGSIFGIEGVFFLYYTSWNLFKTLPVLLVIGIVAFLSGSRALTEVQGRRLAGLR